MYRSIQILLLLVFSPLALLGNELIDYLKQYEGRWLGDFTIHSTASGYSETFPVEQRYWWEDGQLHGISVSDTNNGLKSAKSLTFIKEGKLQSEVITGENTERFFGFLRDGGRTAWFASSVSMPISSISSWKAASLTQMSVLTTATSNALAADVSTLPASQLASSNVSDSRIEEDRSAGSSDVAAGAGVEPGGALGAAGRRL